MRKNSPTAEVAEVAEEAAEAVAAVEAVVTVEVAELDVVTVSHVYRLTDPDKVVAESRVEAKLCLTRMISHAFERSLRL